MAVQYPAQCIEKLATFFFWYDTKYKAAIELHHHDGEVQGEAEEDDDRALLVLESLPEFPTDLAFLNVTEQASAGSFFIGVKGGVLGREWRVVEGHAAISSSSEEPHLSNLEGEEFGVSNGVSSASLA